MKYRRAFRERLKDASVILVSHNADTIRAECDIAAVLTQGKLTMYDTVEEALGAYSLVAR